MVASVAKQSATVCVVKVPLVLYRTGGFVTIPGVPGGIMLVMAVVTSKHRSELTMIFAVSTGAFLVQCFTFAVASTICLRSIGNPVTVIPVIFELDTVLVPNNEMPLGAVCFGGLQRLLLLKSGAGTH